MPVVGDDTPLAVIAVEFKFLQGKLSDSLDEISLLVGRQDVGLVGDVLISLNTAWPNLNTIRVQMIHG